MSAIIESGGNRINWNTPSGAIAGYQIQRTTDRVNYRTVIFLSVIADTLATTTFDSITAPETYSYRVRASNTEGQGAYSDVVAAMGPPPTLTNFQASATGLEVALSWNVENRGSDITAYTLTRTLSGGTAVTITVPSTTATTLTDTVPAAGDYIYTITATNAAGMDTATVAITVNPPAPDVGNPDSNTSIMLTPDFGEESLTLLLGETQEITISGGISPYRAVLSSGDSITIGAVVDGTTLRITAANAGWQL